jgi:hypothetical protein
MTDSPGDTDHESSGQHDLPLSERLLHALDLEDTLSDHITVGHFLAKTGEDSIHLLQALVCLPFCFPVIIPGWGLVAGSVVLYTAYFQLVNKPLDLPRKIEDGKISKNSFKKVLTLANRLISLLEKWITPRRTDYFEGHVIQRFHSSLTLFIGFLLWIPFPAFFPLSNFFPAIAIIALSLSIMEYDGRTIWIAYTLAILAAVYTFLLLYLGKEISDIFLNWWHGNKAK